MIAELDPDVSSHLKAVDCAVLVLTQPRWLGHNSAGPPGGASAESCQTVLPGNVHLSGATIATYAGFKWCCYRHACQVCGGPQPALECCKKNHTCVAPCQ